MKLDRPKSIEENKRTIIKWRYISTYLYTFVHSCTDINYNSNCNKVTLKLDEIYGKINLDRCSCYK